MSLGETSIFQVVLFIILLLSDGIELNILDVCYIESYLNYVFAVIFQRISYGPVQSMTYP